MDKSTNISSPLTNGGTELCFEIETSFLISEYKEQTNIDVTRSFTDYKTIGLYKCIESGYRFFFPLDIAGDGRFYAELENIPWYYSKWKWDYAVASEIISDHSNVLDIGCGEGNFLTFLKEKKSCEVEGLELNPKAAKIANDKGIKVHQELIQDYAQKNESKFDCVCFFQVLEHISDVRPFLHAAIRCTKRNGRIIIVVPNNEPFYLTYDRLHFMNLPPHHMGWWNEKSLAALEQLFAIKLLSIKKQPLEHYSGFAQGFMENKLGLPRKLAKVLLPIGKLLAYLFRSKVNGASICATFEKL